MGKTFVGDIDTEIIVNCGVDISLADPVALLYKKPDGTTGSWEPTIYNSNYLKYSTIEDDLDQEGTYRVQASLTLGDWIGLGESDTFKVYEAFG